MDFFTIPLYNIPLVIFYKSHSYEINYDFILHKSQE